MKQYSNLYESRKNNEDLFKYALMKQFITIDKYISNMRINKIRSLKASNLELKLKEVL